MPLTPFQSELARLLASNRSEDSYLAGGAALHLEPRSIRYSVDLDYFQDSVERVAQAFAEDSVLLEGSGLVVDLQVKQPGYLRALVRGSEEATKVEWSHDTAWRFLPTVSDQRCGFRLHPIDLAINKVLALAGRDEARDYVDTLHIHQELLSLGALLWAAAGKDPGFTPKTLLDLLRRRGRPRPDELARLHTVEALDPVALKAQWMDALEGAGTFVASRPAEEIGCLYWEASGQRFVQPLPGAAPSICCHFGAPGGVFPRVLPGS